LHTCEHPLAFQKPLPIANRVAVWYHPMARKWNALSRPQDRVVIEQNPGEACSAVSKLERASRRPQFWAGSQPAA